MKKNTARRTRWHLLRAKNQAKRYGVGRFRKHIKAGTARQFHSKPVQIWQGEEPEWAVVTRQPFIPPSILCFDRNPLETTSLIDRIRLGFDFEMRQPQPKFLERKGNKAPRLGGYIDFANIEEISTSAAVVLTADYDRVAELIDSVPPTVNLGQWDDGVVTKLFQLGFFNILGHLPDIKSRLIMDGPTLTMRIIRGKKADILGEIDEPLQLLGKFLTAGDPTSFAKFYETIIKVLTTISEAIANVTQHAYGTDPAYGTEHEFASKHIESFWVAAEADKVERKLTVVIYDQGVTIPITYPRLKRKKKVKEYLKRFIGIDPKFDYEFDGTYIRAAMKFGGSRTGETHRGKGFPQMYRLLKSIGAGKLSIRSRGGWCEKRSGSKIVNGSFPHSIGGTLIEWTVELDKL